MEKNKGVIEILNALNQIKHLEFECKLAGSGSLNKYVEDYIQNNNLSSKVKFLGWVIGEEKSKLLKEADIFLLPSFLEGYPNALLEAMQYEIASIASNVGGIPDVIINNETGILIEPGNELQLANAIEFLIQDNATRKALGENGRKRVVNNNTISSAESKFLSNIFELF
jgi:glycosyltransferase involved in cell wall biosynthesis